jgi:diguanylate cyclase (GGDEF)-like protein
VSDLPETLTEAGGAWARPAELLIRTSPAPLGPHTADSAPLQLLLVEDNPGDARLIRELLREVQKPSFQLTHVTTLSDALRFLHGSRFDAILVDLMLPDAVGLEALEPVGEAAPEVPIVVLSGLSDEAVAVQAVAQGAQDYLLKGRSDGSLIARAILYAIERKRSEQYIHYLANHDPLTNLPNRRLLLDRIHVGLALARRSGRMLGVVLLDLDDFKHVNDSLGHLAGDRLLQAVAQRLRSSIRESDTLARIGGDEFALVLPDVGSEEDATVFVEKLHAVLQDPFLVDGNELYMTASIGISLHPKDAKDVPALLSYADAAMYRSKQAGQDTWRFYSPTMRARSGERLVMVSALRRALDGGELVLHYQPQVDLATGRIEGVEALLRWQHPRLGLLLPAHFLLLAEETGLMTRIGRWVFQEAFAQGHAWREAGHENLRIAVNLSNRQLFQDDFVESVVRLLQESGLEPRQVELELTERGLMTNPETAISVFGELRAKGVRISVDDFGVGHSSLSRLKQFPVDSLKIDRTFICDAGQDPVNGAIVLAVITMAHGMGLEVTAEGVETGEELAFLRAHRCNRAQGTYFCGALPARAVSERLLGGPRWT